MTTLASPLLTFLYLAWNNDPHNGRRKRQYISLKKVCESNKADAQAHIDGFYLCHRELKIP
jgi:hypothetical protein